MNGSAEEVCLCLVQVEGTAALRERLPVALGRGLDVISTLIGRLVGETGGAQVRSAADGWLARWPSIPAAVQFATQLQRAALEAEWPTTLLLRPQGAEERDADGTLLHRGLRVRIGVHAGRTDERTDRRGETLVVGPALHQVARLARAAHGGQILLSAEAWREAREGISGEAFVLEDLGAHRFLGLDGLARLYQVLPVELAARRFPPPRTLDVERTNVSGEPLSFVGRAGDLDALAALDDFGVQVVTVVGEPGSGKSRLLRRHAVLAAGRKGQEGAWLCEVSGDGGGAVARAVGYAMDIPLTMGRTVDDAVAQIGYALAGRGPVMVLLDGVEADHDATAHALLHWTKVAPDVRFLVAAARRLGLPGEVAYSLGPLQGDDDRGLYADAITLLDQRGRAFHATSVLDPESVAGLVGQLGGNPLAVELAAGTLGRIDPVELESALAERSGGPLRVLQEVWRLLEPRERAVLGSCAVYPGGFDILGAEAVTDPEIIGPDTAKLVDALVERGLIRVEIDGGAPGVRRFLVPGRVRSFALDALSEDERDVLHALYSDHVLSLCEPLRERAWARDGAEVVARVAAEFQNLLYIARWGLDDERSSPEALDRALRSVLALQPVFERRGPRELQRVLLDAALSRCDKVLGADPVLQVRVIVARAEMHRRAGRHRQAFTDLERGHAIAERWADAEGVALCRATRGLVHFEQGALTEAIEALETAVAEFRDCGNRLREARAMGSIGVLYMEAGRLDEAEQQFEAAVTLFRELGTRHFEGLYLGNAGLLARRRGRMDVARTHYSDAIEIHRETGDRRLQGVMVLNLGSLEYHIGNSAEAGASYELGLSLAREVGDRRTEGSCLGNLGLLALEAEDHHLARERLLQALAIHRDFEDAQGEAADTGFMALLLHFEGHADQARSYYRRAIQLYGECGPERYEALFTAWLAVLEAERGQDEDAATLFELAETSRARVGDAYLDVAIQTLGVARLWMEARAAGDDDAAATAVVKAVAGLRDQVQANAEARLALARVATLMGTQQAVRT